MSNLKSVDGEIVVTASVIHTPLINGQDDLVIDKPSIEFRTNGVKRARIDDAQFTFEQPLHFGSSQSLDVSDATGIDRISSTGLAMTLRVGNQDKMILRADEVELTKPLHFSAGDFTVRNVAGTEQLRANDGVSLALRVGGNDILRCATTEIIAEQKLVFDDGTDDFIIENRATSEKIAALKGASITTTVGSVARLTVSNTWSNLSFFSTSSFNVTFTGPSAGSVTINFHAMVLNSLCIVTWEFEDVSYTGTINFLIASGEIPSAVRPAALFDSPVGTMQVRNNLTVAVGRLQFESDGGIRVFDHSNSNDFVTRFCIWSNSITYQI